MRVFSGLTAAAVGSLLLAMPGLAATGLAATAHPDRHDGDRAAIGRPSTYRLTGDPVDAGGSKFEGIGVDRRTGTFYVSEVTGGEIHRGRLDDEQAQEWLAGDGTDGRWTARGITTDRHGRVYVAGGPNGIDHRGAPDLWVYDRSGRLLSALSVETADAFVNDVTIGPDGAAYLTNSNDPQVFRLAEEDGRWQVDTFVDATGTIERRQGFNLGGIVVSPDREALVVAQGNTGRLWRVDLDSREVSALDTGDAGLVNADGLVRRGHTLWVVRNFSRRLTTLGLDHEARSARLVDDRATDPDRVLTTAKLAGGRLLAVDSHFDEATGRPPYEVVTLQVRR